MENKALLKSRENMYHLLSRLYLLEVDEELLAALKGLKLPEQSPDEDLKEGYEKIGGYLANAKADQETLDDLAVDYARIFLSAGVAQGKAAFPYESVYTSKKHLMMQESRNDVTVLYAQKGLEPRKDMYRVPEDHVGLLLEYMALLCQEDASDKEQKEFLEAHLQNWISAFSADVIKYSSTEFYRGLAKLTKGFLQLEHSLLEEA